MRTQAPPLMPDPIEDGCNAAVHLPNYSWRHPERVRGCLQPPKAMGESGRLLCSWHLKVERAHLEWRDEMTAAEGLANRLSKVLGVSVDVWPNDSPELFIGLSTDEAVQLIRRLREP